MRLQPLAPPPRAAAAPARPTPDAEPAESPHADLARELEIRLASLQRIADGLRAGVGRLRGAADPARIDVPTLAARAEHIGTLRAFHAELTRLAAYVGGAGAEAEADQAAAMHAIQTAAMAAARQGALPAGDAPAARALGGAPEPAPAPAALGARAPRPVADGTALALAARDVDARLESAAEIFAAVRGGELHYIPQWRHFAIRVGPLVLHARLGRVYPLGDCGRPERPRAVRECAKGAACSRRHCAFYHDPATCPGSTDARNFLALDRAYVPGSEGHPPPRAAPRRFGSADRLEADLLLLGAGEARAFTDQVAHDLICALILHQCVLAPAKAGGRPAA